jgi:cytochrome c oxidase assembly protein subunit 11
MKTNPINKAALIWGVNRQMLMRLCVVAGLMFGFGYALVPLYKKICEITGINVLTQRDDDALALAKNTQVDTSRSITIEFDANIKGPWQFKPEKHYITVHPGELAQMNYEIHNNLPRATQGQAIPSYAPMKAGQYFRKVECFCFKQQPFQSNETKTFPVVFVVDPALPKDVTTITLSYTFFEVAGVAQAGVSAK